jgi:hypothetical protein
MTFTLVFELLRKNSLFCAWKISSMQYKFICEAKNEMHFQLAEPGVTHSIHSSCLKSIEGDPNA